jgi:hypothetical protein
MVEFPIENIFVIVGDQVFQQFVGIHMGTSCALLLADSHVFLLVLSTSNRLTVERTEYRLVK